MTCNGQIAEPNTNEHVLAGALQGNLQLSPNFFWYFSHHIHIFLTLSQVLLTIFLIFQPRLMYCVHTPSFVATNVSTNMKSRNIPLQKNGCVIIAIFQKSLHTVAVVVSASPEHQHLEHLFYLVLYS